MFGAAQRCRQHAIGPPTPGEFVGLFRVTGALIVAKVSMEDCAMRMAETPLNWLNDEQRAHCLRKGLIEEIGESQPLPAPSEPKFGADAEGTSEVVGDGIGTFDGPEVPSGTGAGLRSDTSAELVGECIAALDRITIFDGAAGPVPSDAGAPTARKALRDARLRFGNDVICEAVRQRKMRA